MRKAMVFCLFLFVVALFAAVIPCSGQVTDTLLLSCDPSTGTSCENFQNGNAWTTISSHEGIGTDYEGGENSPYGAIMYYDKNSSNAPSVIYSFSTPTSGYGPINPLSNLVSDGSGNYFGSFTNYLNPNTHCPATGSGDFGGFYEVSNVGSTGLTFTMLTCNLVVTSGSNHYGAEPSGQLFRDKCYGWSGSNSNHYCLYATTETGGLNNVGMLVAYDINANTFQDLHDFDTTTSSLSPGCTPIGGLTESSANTNLNGITFYGTSSLCGQYNGGTLFEVVLSTSGTTFSIIHQFGSITNDGTSPQAPVLEVNAGKHHLYGTASAGGNGHGGTDYNGTVYDANLTDSTFTNIYNFGGFRVGDGSTPYGSIFQYDVGVLEGVTYTGSTTCNTFCNLGTIYQLTYNANSGTWTGTIIYSFQGEPNDGARPVDIQEVNNQIIGFAYRGGSSNVGTIFQTDQP